MKLCKDCSHCLLDSKGEADLAHCIRSPIRTHIVTGEALPRFCVNERNALGDCGPEAKYFDAKPNTTTNA